MKETHTRNVLPSHEKSTCLGVHVYVVMIFLDLISIQGV